MRNLRCLDISGNFDLKMETVRNVLNTRGLLSVIADSCDLHSPPAKFFTNVTSDVTSLLLRLNYISDKRLTSFCALRELRRLDLELCQLESIVTTCPLLLKELSLSDNIMVNFPDTCTARGHSLFPELKVLDLSNNRILSLKKACLPNLTYLDLSHNMIGAAVWKDFNIVQFPNLQRLLIQHTTHGGIPSIPSDVFHHPTLEHLSLDGNEIPFGDNGSVSNSVFANCPNLSRLTLEGNDFKNVDEARFMDLFGLLPLKAFSLSHNQLTSLSPEVFSLFPELWKLELAGTGLSAIPDGAFDSLGHLAVLDISDNKLTGIREQTFSKETRQRLTSLGLSRKPFLCSCYLLWFRGWFLSQPALFLAGRKDGTIGDGASDEYQCHNLPGTSLAEFFMADQACLLSQGVTMVIVYICSVLIVAITTVSLVSCFRWHIRLALYEAFRGGADVRRLRFQADNFDFDVFVSYDSMDRAWVRRRLMPELETRQGLRLCVHERDFTPGKNIVQNIADCVEGSKKVLLVFSVGFARSQWCQFELAFCLNHVMDYGDDVIAVCVDDVTSRDVMSGAMRAVLRTTTYIQWEEELNAVANGHGVGQRPFWARLRIALREIF